MTRRALVIEDDGASRTLASGLLDKSGFEVQLAKDGLEALNICYAEEPFDLVLADWYAEPMSGIAFLGAIRQEKRFETMRVIFVSGEQHGDHVRRALRLGADDYILKPLTLEVLTVKLQRLGLQENAGGQDGDKE